MMRRRVPAVLAAAVLCLGACASKENDKPKTEESPSAETKKKADEPEATNAPDGGAGAETKRVEIAAADPPKITVESTGSDPKRELRLSPEPGTEEKVQMTMEMKMKMSMAGQKLPAVDMPPIVIDARGKVDEVTDDGLVLTFIVDKMGLGDAKGANPSVVATMKSMLEGMKSFSAHLEMDRRGTLKGGYVDVPQALPPPIQQMVEQMQHSFAQIQVPLPVDAVGVGAKWTAVSELNQSGLELEQTASYEVTGLEGEVVECDVAVKQKVLDDTFSPPAAPGVKAKIDMFQSGGSGKLALSLDHWAPQTFDTDITIKMGLSMDVMGQTQKQDLDMQMGLQMTRE